MAKKIEDLSLNDQLPGSIKSDGRIQSTVYAADPWLKIIAGAVSYPSVLYNVDFLPGEILDHIAAGFSMSAWNSTWDVERKRRVLKAFIVAYRTRTGTVWAVRQAIEAFGLGVSFTEWWQKEPKGIPHTFEVYVANPDGSSLTLEEQESLRSLIDAAKPVRSHYTMTVSCRSEGSFCVLSLMTSLQMFEFESKQIRQEPMELSCSVNILPHVIPYLFYQFRSKTNKRLIETESNVFVQSSNRPFQFFQLSSK